MFVTISTPWGVTTAESRPQRYKAKGTTAWNTIWYHNQITQERKRSAIKTTQVEDGFWRDPLTYNAWGFKAEARDYSLSVRVSSSRVEDWEGKSSLTPTMGPGYGVSHHGCYFAAGHWWPNPNSNLENRALAECISRIRDEKLNLALALAEAKKSYSMVVQRFVRLANAVYYAKRGQVTKAARALGVSNPKGLANTYLEYKYGWRPMMQDLYGAYTLLTERCEPPLGVTAQRRVTAQLNNPTKPPHLRVWEYTGQTRQMCHVRLDYKVVSPALLQLASLGLTNPALFAWELIPLSFVVDWMLPIGNVLAALDTSMGLEFLGGTSTLVTHGQYQLEYFHLDAWELVGKKPRLDGGAFAMNRKVFTTSPVPGLYIKSPLSTSNAASALALAIQRLRK